MRRLLLGCALALTLASIATAKPVTVDDLAQFKIGVASYDAVVAKLGHPFSIETASDGTKTITYTATKSHVKAATFIPIVGLFAGGATADITTVRMTFDAAGLLTKTWTSDTHADCGSAITGMHCSQ